MKKKELNEMRAKDHKDLVKILDDKKREVLKVMASVRVSKEKNLKKAKALRHDIAQISTIIHEAEIMSGNEKGEKV